MDNPPLSKRSVAFGLAASIACLVNAVIVVVKEKSEAVMAGMKKMTGHHWTTHSLLVLVLFLGLGFLLGAIKGGRGVRLTANRLIGILVASAAVAALGIIGFYLFVD